MTNDWIAIWQLFCFALNLSVCAWSIELRRYGLATFHGGIALAFLAFLTKGL